MIQNILEAGNNCVYIQNLQLETENVRGHR